jgi:type II secretory pathway predicted ATPase ExeA
MRTTARPLPVDPVRAFQPTADPAVLWLTGQYDDALRTLRVAVMGRQGLLVLVGEAGTGKTALAHALAVRVRAERVVVGRLLHPVLEGMDLLTAIAEAFGLPATFMDREGFVEQFRRFVAETAAAGRRVLLIVDEAQRLSRASLVDLGRLPYADGAGNAASLSVLIVGLRSLLVTLRADVVEPDVLCHLRPLTREQTAEYIAHRLGVVRHRGRLFTPSALRKIWVVSEGIPNAANALCVDALSRLRETGRRTVTASMIDRSPRAPGEAHVSEAALVPLGRIPNEPPPSARPSRRWPPLVGAVCLVLTVTATLAVKRYDLVPPFLAGPIATTASTVSTAAPESENGTDTPRAGEVDVPVESALEQSAVIEVARPPVLPERLDRARPSAAPAPLRAIPAASSPRATDDDDATVVIDWLLKGRQP